MILLGEWIVEDGFKTDSGARVAICRRAFTPQSNGHTFAMLHTDENHAWRVKRTFSTDQEESLRASFLRIREVTEQDFATEPLTENCTKSDSYESYSQMKNFGSF